MALSVDVLPQLLNVCNFNTSYETWSTVFFQSWIGTL